MIKKIKHNDMFLNIGEKGHFFLSLEETAKTDFAYGYVNTNVILGAGNEVECEENMIMPTTDFFLHKDTVVDGKNATISYDINSKPVVVTEKMEMVDGLNIVKQVTEIENKGKDPVHISKLSATNVTGIGFGGSKYFENDDRFIVHYSYGRWSGEGQWFKKTLRELGLYPATLHPWEKCTYRFQSIGSYSTREYYPLIIIEDTERKECWFFEREGSESWYIDISAFEGFNAEFITVSVGGMDENIGWTYDLQPGEKYSTDSCFYGMVKGGFEEVVRTLLDYKRKIQLMPADTKVMFNDFMNCNWAMPTYDRVIPLVDAAAEMGCEGFCIDAGWSVVGEWDPDDSLFGDLGFKGTIEYIKNKGLRPGVWFEFERCTDKIAQEMGQDMLMHRNGNVVAHYRPKLDLSNPKARKWLIEKVRVVYDMGVRFIKNDQNNDEHWGVNWKLGESELEGLRRKNQGYLKFIDMLHEEFPDLVVENCSAGAGRAEHGFLKRFSLQSVTDQENYRLMPSIFTGSLMWYGPEKAGSWCYPYPLLYKNFDTFEIPAEELATHVDGRETIFNMVSGMSGYMYLSGKIHLADKLNKELIKESIATYKTFNKSLSNRYPVFPTGLKNMHDKTMQSLGLVDKDGKDMLLSVWALENKEFTLDLTKYGFNTVERLYPSANYGVDFEYKDGLLKFKFEKDYSALMLKLSKA